MTTDYYNSTNHVKVRYVATDTSDFVLDIDQLRLEYTTIAYDYYVEAEVGWEIDDGELYSVDYLYFVHSSPVSITFEVYDWVSEQFEAPPTGSPLNLQTYDEYVNVTNGVLVRYKTANHTSSFDLQIDQLRVDYTRKIDWYSVHAEVVWDLTDALEIYDYDYLTFAHKTTQDISCTLEIWDT